MPPPFRWTYSGNAVLHEVAQAPIDAREDFTVLMYRLAKNPRDKAAGALPSRDGTPGGWTAPFDDALLFYQVLADHPHFYLLLVRWNQARGQEGASEPSTDG